ncbi:CDP-glucose 4,6-dehydratase [Thiorhodovibrio frisius]|uniref:CDP-glucose 4,6-dehydratase n=1 Tax=Thiorhodovibrio frisius TaxID=631362 RepID=UPI00022C7085|nr:CDP-glucose 4,6-dehydratase [Thiorhodovibrio frisius]WPL20175.1 CDP-glucose 4,6-dehydratase [Thiorhodovibrio frisius]
MRAGYRDPLGTWATNTLGTAHLLDALRPVSALRVVVAITTDKVYQNLEQPLPYRETDALGGHDPYSASKAAAELVIASYRDAFLAEQGVAVASARAGNVIGGGDWADDRLLPDAVRAWHHGQPLPVRRPEAIRPWQHVLEPLNAYLQLAEQLWAHPERAGGYNFGPHTHEAASVRQVIEHAQVLYGCGEVLWGDGQDGPHEAGWLALEIAKARHQLGLAPRWPWPPAWPAPWTGIAARPLAKQRAPCARPTSPPLKPPRPLPEVFPLSPMSRFTPHATPIADLILLERHSLGDARGFLERLYCQEELRPLLGERRIVQINRTLTAQAGTVRGLHFQHPPHAELKAVTCLRGAIFDVAVDLRQGSSTFLHWHAERLSGDQPRTLVIPEGFAHGFQTLTDNSGDSAAWQGRVL